MDFRSALMGVGFAFMWASAFATGRMIVTAAPPMTALFARFACSAVVAILLALALGQNMRLTRAEWRVVILFGISQNVLYLGLNWFAMQWVEASAAAIIASTMPLMVAGMGWALMRERLRPLALVGLVTGIIGVALIMGVRLQHGLHVPGAILCLIGAVGLSMATLSVGRAGGSRNMMMIVGLQMVVGAAILLVPALLLEWGRPIAWSWQVVLAFLYTVLLPSVGATWIWLLLVERVGPVRAATYHFLSPFFGVVIAAAMLGERFGMSDLLGALIVAAGILMVQLSRLPPARGHRPG